MENGRGRGAEERGCGGGALGKEGRAKQSRENMKTDRLHKAQLVWIEQGSGCVAQRQEEAAETGGRISKREATHSAATGPHLPLRCRAIINEHTARPATHTASCHVPPRQNRGAGEQEGKSRQGRKTSPSCSSSVTWRHLTSLPDAVLAKFQTEGGGWSEPGAQVGGGVGGMRGVLKSMVVTHWAPAFANPTQFFFLQVKENDTDAWGWRGGRLECWFDSAVMGRRRISTLSFD